MKSAVETLEPTRVKITVEVPFTELEPNLKAAYRRIAQQVNVPGFRRGKVPPAVIDRQIGRGAVLDEAINDALPGLYIQALQDNELAPLTQPELDITRLEDNDLLEFTAEVDVRPPLELPSFDDLAVSVDDISVTDDDVDAEVESLRERFAALKDVDRAAVDGDHVTIDLVATQDGETVAGGEVRGYTYTVGSGQLVEGADEAIRGLAAGEEKTFASSLSGGDHAGEDVEVTVTVQAVREQELPELDDEFAQTASEFDTVAELREDLREKLVRQGRLAQAADARDAVVDAMVEQVEVPLPETVVADEMDRRRAELEQQLTFAGMTLQQWLDNEEQTIDEFEADLEKRVRDLLATQFILAEIAQVEQIEVAENEFAEHLMRRAQQSGESPDAFMQHMVEHNHLPEMREEVLQTKALRLVVERATITDASGAPVDLVNLQPDGTLGDPEQLGEPVASQEPASSEEADAAGEASDPE